MNQIDFVGGLPPAGPNALRAVRNTRSSAAEEKAQLLLELGRMCQTPPPEGLQWFNKPDTRMGRLPEEQQSALPEHPGFGRAARYRDQERAAVSLT